MHNKVREPLFHIVKRDTLPWYQAWGIRAIAIVLALLLCALITTLCTHLNPLKVFGTMFSGAFGSPRKMWILGQNLALSFSFFPHFEQNTILLLLSVDFSMAIVIDSAPAEMPVTL